MTRRRARLVMLAGVLVALGGLIGFWLTRDVARGALSDEQRQLLGLGADAFHASMVLAGRDIFYDQNANVTPVYAQDGTILRYEYDGVVSTAGINTDTILYVDVHGDAVTLIAIPRDLYLQDVGRRINGVYARGGAEELRRRVEAILGVPVDYYAVVKLDIFQNLVDALGGVEVDVPYAMNYDDNVGGLHIHFPAGPRLMDGVDASKFVRYRHSLRGDIDRLDNVKRLAYAMLQRVKELNLRAVTLLPELVDTFFQDVETNASPALARQLVSRIPNLELTATATLPNEEATVPGVGSVVLYDAATVHAFMAGTFGGTARAFQASPDVTLLVTDRSGTPGMGAWYRDRLVGFGVPEDRIIVREDDVVDPTPTRMLATLASWEDADYFAELLHAGKQQVDRLQPYRGTQVQLELVLGADAAARISQPETVLAVHDEP